MATLVNTLVVDDEENIRFFMHKTLQKAGHTVTTAASGEQALDQLRETFFDLVVVDLKLGGKVDGLRVLEAVRWRWPETVVVILTAHGSLESAMAAIQEGVDGYLLKPVEPDEVRRVVQEALTRRKRLASAEGKSAALLQAGALSVDQDKHSAVLNGRPLELTPCEFKLLVYLMQNTERVVPPQELVRVIQEYDCDDKREAREIVKWYIHRLRRKLEHDPTHPRYILNVRGVGYTLGSG